MPNWELSLFKIKGYFFLREVQFWYFLLLSNVYYSLYPTYSKVSATFSEFWIGNNFCDTSCWNILFICSGKNISKLTVSKLILINIPEFGYKRTVFSIKEMITLSFFKDDGDMVRVASYMRIPACVYNHRIYWGSVLSANFNPRIERKYLELHGYHQSFMNFPKLWIWKTRPAGRYIYEDNLFSYNSNEDVISIHKFS